MSFYRSLENLSIRKKLITSFGAMLLLICILVIAGGKSIDVLLKSSDKGDLANSINADLLRAKAMRLAYLTSEDDSEATQLQTFMGTIKQQLAQHSTVFNHTDNQALVQKTTAETERYIKLLQQLQQQLQHRQQLRQQWQALGQRLAQQLQQAQSALVTQQQSADWQQKMVQLAAHMAQLRLVTADFVNSRQAASERDVHRHFEHVERLVGSFAGRLPQGRQLARDLAEYRGFIGQYAKQQQQLEQLEAHFAQSAKHLHRYTGQLMDNQHQQRAEASKWAILLLSVTAIVALLVGLVAAFLISHVITQPIQQILQQARQIARGDLTVSHATKRKDELGQLQRAINDMATQLRDIMTRVGSSVSQLASASTQLSAASLQNQQGTQQQRDETDQVATAMNEMTSTVAEVARNAEQAARAADEADQISNTGVKEVGGAASLISELAKTVHESASSMTDLKEATDGIGKVIEVINDVAEQTNLLALNAAIEAARAGEAGRGFAVVADEVRSLASRTQKSTAEVGALIERLQNTASNAEQMMEHSRTMADDNVKNAEGAVRMLNEISGAVSTIQQMNQQIATASEEQSSVSEEINRSIYRVREVAEQTATASNETADATEGLAKLGQQLQQLLDRFKL